MSPHVRLGESLGPLPYSRAGRPLMDTSRPAVERVYEYLVQYKSSHDGNAPTVREIGEACGISSTSVVHYWLIRLTNQGLIRRPEPKIGMRCSTQIEIVGGKWNAPAGETPAEITLAMKTPAENTLAMKTPTTRVVGVDKGGLKPPCHKES